MIGYQAGIKALKGYAETKATEIVEDISVKAETDYEAIQKNLTSSEATLLEMNKRLGAMVTLEQVLMDIKDAIKHGNPWEPFSKNIKDVTKDGVKYEYAVFRNGGLRTVTASTWNEGWRVVTSPHMTRDSEKFVLGGSMWIWDTQDERDNRGVYHLYYYADDKGIVATQSGNGYRGAYSKGEGIVYRRLRK